jgi:hypothetical protein
MEYWLQAEQEIVNQSMAWAYRERRGGRKRIVAPAP